MEMKQNTDMNLLLWGGAEAGHPKDSVRLPGGLNQCERGKVHIYSMVTLM